MSEVLIYKTKEEWEKVPSVHEAISVWENAHQLKIPEDYKSFMEKYDGGRVYPLFFCHNIQDKVYWPWGEDYIILDPLYDWSYVIEQRDADNLNLRRPKNTFAIGADPSGIEAVLSLDKRTYGQIYIILFHRNTKNDDFDMTLHLISKTFREFIFEKLYDNSDKDGYEHWYIPVDKSLIKKVEF